MFTTTHMDLIRAVRLNRDLELAEAKLARSTSAANHAKLNQEIYELTLELEVIAFDTFME